MDYSRTVIKGGHLKRDIPRSFFDTPRTNTKTSLDFSDIVSHTSSPGWVSWNADRQTRQHSDMALPRHCCRADQWGKVPQAWLCSAAPAGTLIQRKFGNGKWYFSVTPPGASAVLAWPAREIVQNGVLLYFMELDLAFADLKWMVILELEDYEGMRIEWAGPDFGAREGQSIDRCGLNGGSGFRPRARTRKAEMCSGCFAITLGFSSREHLGS